MSRRLGSLLAALLLLGALGACGEDETGTVTDAPAPSPSRSPSEDPATGRPAGGPVDFELAGLLTETAAGGTVSEAAFALGDDTAVREFIAPLGPALQAAVQQAVEATTVADEELLYGAVVAVGCDVPTEVAVTSADSGLLVEALKVPEPKSECFAPMTTVALVLVPATAVG